MALIAKNQEESNDKFVSIIKEVEEIKKHTVAAPASQSHGWRGSSSNSSKRNKEVEAIRANLVKANDYGNSYVYQREQQVFITNQTTDHQHSIDSNAQRINLSHSNNHDYDYVNNSCSQNQTPEYQQQNSISTSLAASFTPIRLRIASQGESANRVFNQNKLPPNMYDLNRSVNIPTPDAFLQPEASRLSQRSSSDSALNQHNDNNWWNGQRSRTNKFDQNNTLFSSYNQLNSIEGNIAQKSNSLTTDYIQPDDYYSVASGPCSTTSDQYYNASSSPIYSALSQSTTNVNNDYSHQGCKTINTFQDSPSHIGDLPIIKVFNSEDGYCCD